MKRNFRKVPIKRCQVFSQPSYPELLLVRVGCYLVEYVSSNPLNVREKRGRFSGAVMVPRLGRSHLTCLDMLQRRGCNERVVVDDDMGQDVLGH